MTTYSLDDIFYTALGFHHYANTAYPLTPYSLRQYEVHGRDERRKLIESNVKKQKMLNLYVHIPFCQHRCKFCEYVVLDHPNEQDYDKYVDYLLKEIDMYAEVAKGIPIIGYDLGGGTPCFLSVSNLKRITEKLLSSFSFSDGVSFSIETTPVIAANDPEKIKAIREMGYDRISMGFQTVNEKLLEKLEREGSKHLYDRAVENIRKAGFKRLNIDLMYGFASQSNDDFRSTIKYAIAKNPEYITLYRNRYKGTKIESEAGAVSLHKANMQYAIAYEELTAAGYKANNGKNTFSRIDGDYGTSDYLTSRVIDAVSYIGMGLGAQSFVGNYLAYNLGCTDHKLERYFAALDAGDFPVNDIADLPHDEVVAKALSVMFYFGFISQKSYRARFNEEFSVRFKDEIKYLKKNNIMDFSKDDPDKFMLTDYGVGRLSGAIALFYSDRSKDEMFNLYSKKVDQSKYDDVVMRFYDRSSFDSPSIATDVVVFDKEHENVVLVSRAENPFVGKLAFPGGFYTKDDCSIENCAKRELYEETHLEVDGLKLAFINDKKDRDPRGWIVSVVYIAEVDKDFANLCGDSDALYAKWYSIDSLTEDQFAFDHWDVLKRVLRT